MRDIFFDIFPGHCRCDYRSAQFRLDDLPARGVIEFLQHVAYRAYQARVRGVI
jgi:hypothetical protein